MEKCKNCGADLKPGDKFCKKCGTPVDEIHVSNGETTSKSTSEIKNNETIANLKKHSLNYFTWYKDSLLKPSIVKNDNKYFGLTTLLLNAILAAYAIFTVLDKLFLAAKDALEDTAISDYSTIAKEMKLNIPTGFSLYFQILMLAVLYYIVFLIVGFVCKKYLVDQKVSLFDYANQLGSYSSSLIVAQIIMAILLLMSVPGDLTSLQSMSALFSLLGSIKFVVVVLAVISSIWTVAYVSSIVLEKAQANMDKIYVAVITLLLNNLVLYLVYKMIANSMISKYYTLFKDLM